MLGELVVIFSARCANSKKYIAEATIYKLFIQEDQQT